MKIRIALRIMALLIGSTTCFDFNNIVPEDSDCNGVVTDGICEPCYDGTYLNHTTNTCMDCPFDTYSTGGEPCERCGDDLGTTHKGAWDPEDCVPFSEICMVPELEYVAIDDTVFHQSRVEAGDNVDFHCQENFQYGGNDRFHITCSNERNNFPSSCRKIEISASNVIVGRGGSATLTCSVTGSDTGSVQWFKGESSIPITSDETSHITQTMPQDPSSTDPHLSITKLMIRDFNFEDAGHYFCIADYEEPLLNEQSEIQMRILDILMSQAGKEQLQIGNDIHFTCSLALSRETDSSLNGHYRFNWYFNGEQMDESNATVSSNNSAMMSVLGISNAKLSHSGNYRCEGKYLSTIYEPIILQTEMTVMIKGFQIHPKTQDILKGNEMRLKCIFIGTPEDVIYWRKDAAHIGGDIETTYNWTIGEITSELLVTHASLDDSGNYFCEIPQDTFDIRSFNASVFVFDKPSALENVKMWIGVGAAVAVILVLVIGGGLMSRWKLNESQQQGQFEREPTNNALTAPPPECFNVYTELHVV